MTFFCHNTHKRFRNDDDDGHDDANNDEVDDDDGDYNNAGHYELARIHLPQLQTFFILVTANNLLP